MANPPAPQPNPATPAPAQPPAPPPPPPKVFMQRGNFVSVQTDQIAQKVSDTCQGLFGYEPFLQALINQGANLDQYFGPNLPPPRIRIYTRQTLDGTHFDVQLNNDTFSIDLARTTDQNIAQAANVIVNADNSQLQVPTFVSPAPAGGAPANPLTQAELLAEVQRLKTLQFPPGQDQQIRQGLQQIEQRLQQPQQLPPQQLQAVQNGLQQIEALALPPAGGQPPAGNPQPPAGNPQPPANAQQQQANAQQIQQLQQQIQQLRQNQGDQHVIQRLEHQVRLLQQPPPPPPNPLPIPNAQVDLELDQISNLQLSQSDRLNETLLGYTTALEANLALHLTAQEGLPLGQRALLPRQIKFLKGQKQAALDHIKSMFTDLQEFQKQKLEALTALSQTHLREKKAHPVETDPQPLITRQEQELQALLAAQMAEYQALFSQQLVSLQEFLITQVNELQGKGLSPQLITLVRSQLRQISTIVGHRQTELLPLIRNSQTQYTELQTERHQALRVAYQGTVLGLIDAEITKINQAKARAQAALAATTAALTEIDTDAANFANERLAAYNAQQAAQAALLLIDNPPPPAVIPAAFVAGALQNATTARGLVAAVAADPTVATAQLPIVTALTAPAETQATNAEAQVQSANAALAAVRTARQAAAQTAAQAAAEANARLWSGRKKKAIVGVTLLALGALGYYNSDAIMHYSMPIASSIAEKINEYVFTPVVSKVTSDLAGIGTFFNDWAIKPAKSLLDRNIIAYSAGAISARYTLPKIFRSTTSRVIGLVTLGTLGYLDYSYNGGAMAGAIWKAINGSPTVATP